jgi:DNA-binding CsgD family transcriptional regulator
VLRASQLPHPEPTERPPPTLLSPSLMKTASRRQSWPTSSKSVRWSVTPSALQLIAVDHPFALQARGDWQAAAKSWAELGCPYHQAAALADSQDPATLLEALPILDSLGATPLAPQVRAGLRQLGVPNLPRGPVAGTRENPAGLTDRQLEVLRLLARGLTNGEIATQLVLSVRTVDRHVAEILAKLGAASRRQAAARAETLGIASPRP